MEAFQDTEMVNDWTNEYDKNGESSQSQKPLRRGDACLACRKRRIRCTAEKPACATCVRLHKHCVYETIQRPSRIAKLKDRISELESQVADMSDKDKRQPSTSTSEESMTPPLHTFTNADFAFDASRRTSGTFTLPASGPPQPKFNAQATVSLAELVQMTDSHAQQDIASSSYYFSTPAGQASLENIPSVSPNQAGLPSFGTPVPYAQSTNPRPLQAPDPNFNFDFDLLDPTMMELSAEMDLSANMELPTDTPPEMSTTYGGFDGQNQLQARNDPPLPGLERADPSGPVYSMGPTGYAGFDGQNELQAHNDPPLPGLERADPAGPVLSMGIIGADIGPHDSPSTFAVDIPPFETTKTVKRGFGLDMRRAQASRQNAAQMATAETWPLHFKEYNTSRILGVAPDDNGSNGLLGGWFDPDDVPPGVRDHLLDLYFSRGGVLQLLLNVPRFYARLTLPPSKRPHPALLYTMYMCGTRQSTRPALRALEGRFYEIAQAKIHQGLREADRLLDIVRALVLTTGYLFAREWYSLAYNTAGSTIRLAIACGLHRIPSSVWTVPRRYHLAAHATLRTAGHALEPPEDAADLGERINTFWAVYEIDQCTFVAYQWDSLLRIREITTPLPRPLEDYTLGIVTRADDIRIASVLDTSHTSKLNNYTDFLSLRLRALTLLASTVQLRHREPEMEEGTLAHYDSVHPRLPESFGEARVSAQQSTPREFANIKAAMDRYCRELPAQHALLWEKWDEGHWEPKTKRRVSKETAVLWFIIGNAYIHLWNIRMLSSPNEKAVLVARKMATFMISYADVAVMGGYASFLLSIWFEVKRVLLREMKRLETLGLVDAAAEFGQLLDRFDKAFEEWSASQSAEVSDSIERAIVETKVYDQLRAMTTEQWLEAMADTDM